MKTLFAVIALPHGTNDPAALWHMSMEVVRANSSFASGQITELQHRIDRMETGFVILALAFMLLACAIWLLRIEHKHNVRRLTKLEEAQPK